MKNKYTDLIIGIGAGLALIGTIIFRKKLERLAKEKAKDIAAGLMDRESGLSHETSRKAMDVIVN